MSTLPLSLLQVNGFALSKLFIDNRTVGTVSARSAHDFKDGIQSSVTCPINNRLTALKKHAADIKWCLPSVRMPRQKQHPAPPENGTRFKMPEPGPGSAATYSRHNANIPD